ncbi:MAG: hypothetical protein ACK54Z_12580 [Cyanobacteriota bacterium]
MPIWDTIKPATMRISAFLDGDFTTPVQPLPNQMVAAFDPASLKIEQRNVLEEKQGACTSGAQTGFHYSKSTVLTVKLTFVGVDFGPYGFDILSEGQQDVQKELDLFERLCKTINGASHEPAYVRLNWGQGGRLNSSFDARLSNYDVSYGLFARGGKVLVADLTAEFTQYVPAEKDSARLRLSSPDLSHRHLVLAGETLPMLCLRYYGSTAPYLQVAAFNQLDDIRTLTPGEQLLFPPLNSAGVEL